MYSYNATSTIGGKQWLALSTQSVGVGQGGTVSMLARVSLVDYRGNIIMDTFVRPTIPVVSYRTRQTGITQANLENATSFDHARALVENTIAGKIIVGYSLWLDLAVLGLTHPAFGTRDMALFLPYRLHVNNNPNAQVGLATLVHHFMRRAVAVEHQDSLENARACMDLFRSSQDTWEKSIDRDEWPCALPPSSYARCYS